MNTALILSYDGTRYHGWQSQKNGTTIQETVTSAIEKTLDTSVYLSGVGRTDAGVHAKRYVANFKAPCSIPMDRLPMALNSRLPMDIAVAGACEVPEDFDARFNCLKKEYTYLIRPSRIRDPFQTGRTYFYSYPLNVVAMQEASRCFTGRQDFAAVRSMGTPVKSTVREIFYCEVDMIEELVRIRVCADGFLYNMARAISGTLLYVGQGKLSPRDIPGVLESRDRERAGPTLPACGLYMTRLWYDLPQLQSFGLDL